MRRQPFAHPERLGEQRQVRWETEVMPSNDCKHRREHMAEAELAKRLREVRGHEFVEIGGESVRVDRLAADAEAHVSRDERRSVARREGNEHAAQRGARRLVDFPDHAEVDEADASARLDEEVPGMRVGVEEAVLEDRRSTSDVARWASATRSMPAAASASRSSILRPRSRSSVKTRALLSSRWTAGMRTSGSLAKFAANRSTLFASRRSRAPAVASS